MIATMTTTTTATDRTETRMAAGELSNEPPLRISLAGWLGPVVL
jgi:hypothetical protein